MNEYNTGLPLREALRLERAAGNTSFIHFGITVEVLASNQATMKQYYKSLAARKAASRAQTSLPIE